MALNYCNDSEVSKKQLPISTTKYNKKDDVGSEYLERVHRYAREIKGILGVGSKPQLLYNVISGMWIILILML